MAINRNLADPFCGPWIDDDKTSDGSDVDTFRPGVIAHVVRVASDADRPSCREGLRVDELQRPCVSVRNSDRAHIGHDCDALWFVEAGQRLQVRGPGGIQHFDSVVAERRHKQTLPCRIKGQMIDPPLDVWQLDRGDLLKRG
jgi:hypothetical protein